jgi:uncharacterized protein YfcZ (UPF0381/DUF406 family)
VSAFVAFAARNWRAIGIGLLALLLVGQEARVRFLKGDLREARAELKAERAASAAFAAQVRATSESIARRAVELARRVEASQARITQETEDDYQTRLARLRADFDRRLRAETADRAGAGGGGDGVPGLPGAAGRPDGAAAPAALGAGFEFACRANTIQLEGLQVWVRRQAAVER